MSSKKARTWVPTVTTAVAVAALSVPLAAGVANASPVTADVPAACSTVPVSDRAKPVVEFACDMALKQVDVKQFSPEPNNPKVPAVNYFIAEAWNKAGVTLKGMKNIESFYGETMSTGTRKNHANAVPGDIVFIPTMKMARGVYLGDNKIAGVKSGKIEIITGNATEAVEPV
ncbi:hypothetical protein [Streptomyces sp. NPDC056492]|uniref:hypothetical protein n=1 Tax=unclassified Streptomyces TaxID=2593676 RepID=UPI0036D0A4C4